MSAARRCASGSTGRRQPIVATRPHRLRTALTPAQEAITVELRRTLLLSADDLLVVVREFIKPEMVRSALQRLLVRHGVSQRKDLISTPEGETPPKKGFKNYVPGYLHIDIKYLPQMSDEPHRTYLFVAIDRAARWVYVRSYANQSQASSTNFLRRLHAGAPMRIEKLLTENGSQFTDCFTTQGKKPSG